MKHDIQSKCIVHKNDIVKAVSTMKFLYRFYKDGFEQEKQRLFSKRQVLLL